MAKDIQIIVLSVFAFCVFIMGYFIGKQVPEGIAFFGETALICLAIFFGIDFFTRRAKEPNE